jgi:glutamate-1-semialdehyde 2,1-aminomutase
MFTGFFRTGEVWNYADAKASDTDRFARFHAAMLQRGVYMAPSQFEAAFVSTAHDEAALARTLDAADESFAQLADVG